MTTQTQPIRFLPLVAFAITSWVFGLGQASADDSKWELLGEKHVMFRIDRDVIPVTISEGRFSKIQLGVEGAAIEFYDLTVVFGNGETQNVPVRAVIPKNGRTREIDLPGALRVINRVELVYRSLGPRARGRATVKLWGRGPSQPSAPQQGGIAPVTPTAPAIAPAAASPDVIGGRRELLGERVVNHRLDRDTIEVTATEGRFRAVELEVSGSGIEFLDLDVIYGNGEHQDIQVRERIAAGGHTRRIDLPGDARVIRRVALVYRTPPRGRGRATVRLFGYR